MQRDTKNQFIKTILELGDITGKTILEIGCGTGRITGDLARYARLVIAIDPNKRSIEIAKRKIKSQNVRYIVGGVENLPRLSNFFDLIVYSLSLHHLPKKHMIQSLKNNISLLKDSGKIMIIEPGNGGSFIELEETFGLGDGKEKIEKEDAVSAITSFLKYPGNRNISLNWKILAIKKFQTDFYFKNLEDFYKMFVEREWNGDNTRLNSFLDAHTENEGIRLFADRTAYLLSKN